MLTAILTTMLCLQEERITLTVYFVRASQEERGGVDPALKEIDPDLKEMIAFNRFDIAGSAILKYSPTSDSARTTFAVRDGGRYHLGFTPQQSLGGRISLQKLWIQEQKSYEDVTISGGLITKFGHHSRDEIFVATVEVPEGKLTVLGSFVVEGKSGPQTFVVAVKAEVR